MDPKLHSGIDKCVNEGASGQVRIGMETGH